MPDTNESRVPVSFDPYWAIDPFTLKEIADTIAGHRPAITAGPATDAQRRGVPIQTVNGVGIIHVSGVLTKRMSWMSALFGGTSYLGVKAAVNAAVADKSIEEIMLAIDSPGGSVMGLDDAANHIAAAREKKPITAYIDGLGASAAYYLASQATEIRMGRTDMVGSIGTISVLYDLSAKAAKEGVKPVVISTGEHKGTGVPGTEITKSQIAEMQKMVDFYGQAFQAAVVRGRKMDPKAVAALADGRVWTGDEAVSLGLVDRVATFEETIADVRARADRRAASRTARGRAAAMRISR